MSLELKEIEKELEKKERTMDLVMAESRVAVRHCANAIKSMHSNDLASAKKDLSGAESILKKLKPYHQEFKNHIDHIFQEYVEALVLLSIKEGKGIPSHKKIGSPHIPYLLGLLDCIGELKREMYEFLRKGKKKEAEEYFEKMELIFHELMHLKYSNSVLPDFRRKQDVARIQIEQARGELI